MALALSSLIISWRSFFLSTLGLVWPEVFMPSCCWTMTIISSISLHTWGNLLSTFISKISTLFPHFFLDHMYTYFNEIVIRNIFPNPPLIFEEQFHLYSNASRGDRRAHSYAKSLQSHSLYLEWLATSAHIISKLSISEYTCAITKLVSIFCVPSNNASFINEERQSAMRSCLHDGDSDYSSVVWNTQLCSFCKCLLKWPFVLYFRLHDVHVYCFDSTLYISLINSSWLFISAACAVTVGKLSAN